MTIILTTLPHLLRGQQGPLNCQNQWTPSGSRPIPFRVSLNNFFPPILVFKVLFPVIWGHHPFLISDFPSQSPLLALLLPPGP